MAGKKDAITIRRGTSESKIVLTLARGPRDAAFKKKIKTPLHFFNHMLETISWRACFNISVSVETTDYKLTHVICEDVGLALGEAFLDLFNRGIESGINGSGAAEACIDEALGRAVVSFEERALLAIDKKLRTGRELVEDMQQEDLIAFFEGFAQGAKASVHLDLIRGANPHHIWESVFRAFGEALRASFAECPWRSGTTPGVKGRISIEKE
jgi:imidazoleglycerol-phosphate dehydratase